MTSIQELFIIALFIILLSMTGWWPAVVRGLRQLRGEDVPEEPQPRGGDLDIDMCYKVLGVSPTASWDDIQRAYRVKAQRHHPDHGGDDDIMKALNEAYAKLRQVRRR